jgi:hypothetical protein
LPPERSTLPACRRPLRRAAALAALTGALAAAAPIGSAAASGPTFTLKPSPPTRSGYFVVNGRPGATVRKEVRVLNVGDEAGTTAFYSVDATTGQTSGAVYRSHGEPRRGVGRWIKVGTETLTLAPGESRLVSLRVHVPSGTSPGQYLGGIVTQRATQNAGSEPSGDKGSFKVKIQELSVVAVQVNVPGPRRARMRLTGIKVGNQPGHQSVLLGIGNTGNVLVKGRGSLKVTTAAGRPLKRATFNLDTFVPDTHIDFPVYTKGKALAPGSYRGTVSIAYDGQRLTHTFPFTITAAQTAQVFGSPASAAAPPAGSSDKTLIYALVGVSAASLGAAFYFWRNRRPV